MRMSLQHKTKSEAVRTLRNKCDRYMERKLMGGLDSNLRATLSTKIILY